MRLIHKKLEKDGQGSISLLAQEDEDMWHVYNLIQPGDLVRALTFRNVKKVGPTGSVRSEKVRVTITVEVSSIDFDTKSSEIRISGRNREENKYIKMGAHHTLELALHRKFSISKSKWDTIHLERVEMATNPTTSADLAAIVLQEGLAHVCLITSYTTLIRQKITQTIPRKRAGSESRHSKALNRFYEDIYEAVVRHIDFSVVKCVIVAGPGFYKEECIKRIIAHANKGNKKSILENKNKFIPRHASSGHMQALREVLADPSVADLIKETKAFDEVKTLERFFEMMNKNSDQAFYGYNDVVSANEAKAVDSLLVTDTLFRSKDIRTRQKYVKLVESCRENGAKVQIFSSLHVSGQQLDQLTGVAAILRFPYVLESDLDIPPIAEEAEAKSFPSTKKKTAGSARDNPDEKKQNGVKPRRRKKKKKKSKIQSKEYDGKDIDDFDGCFLGDF
ncbi:hypothetical protein AAMO2058_000891200 [Amorphochlora amoebiformis]